MPRPGCHLKDCPFDPLTAWVKVPIAVMIGVFFLKTPLLKGLGIEATARFSAFHIDPNWDLLGPVVALTLCGIYAYYHATERDHFPLFMIDMVSLPAIINAVMNAHAASH